MSGIVRTVCRAINIGFSAADLVQYTSRPESRTFEGSLGGLARVVGLGAASLELGGETLGFSNSTFRSVKKVELVARLAESYLDCHIDCAEFQRIDSFGAYARLIEKKLIVPFIHCGRLMNEHRVYKARAFLDMSPAERLQETCEDWVTTSTGERELVTRPITEAECRETITNLEPQHTSHLWKESVHKIGVGAFVADLIYHSMRQPDAVLLVNPPGQVNGVALLAPPVPIAAQAMAPAPAAAQAVAPAPAVVPVPRQARRPIDPQILRLTRLSYC